MKAFIRNVGALFGLLGIAFLQLLFLGTVIQLAVWVSKSVFNLFT
jgi:hypothetical protein